MALRKKAIWDGYNLPELRKLPCYRAGQAGLGLLHTKPNPRPMDRAAYKLGKDEAQLTRNFNRVTRNFWRHD